MSAANNKRQDSADALRALAEQQPSVEDSQAGETQHPAAESQIDPQAGLNDALDAPPPMSDGDVIPLADDEAIPAAELVDIDGLPTRAESHAVRRARAATLAHQSRRTHSHQFKRTMIPLLLVVGILLIVMGAVTAFCIPDSDTAEPNALITPGMATAGVVLAFPMGAILLFGAWFFHRELRQLGKV